MTHRCQAETKTCGAQKYNKSCRKGTTKVVGVCYNPAHFPGECPSHEHWPTRRASVHSVEWCPAHTRERQPTMESLEKNRSVTDRFIDAIFVGMVLISTSGLLYLFSRR